MPISLCEWRVRIGRFVQWMREYEIIERKEKALKERTRLLKILHERLLKTKEDLEGKEDECETKTNNSSNGETDDQSGPEITNNSNPNEPLKKKSFPTHSPIQKSNVAPKIRANSKNNYTNSTFFNISFILPSLLLLIIIFFSVFSFSSRDDFLYLLESSQLPSDWEDTSSLCSWRYTWPILMICSTFAFGLFSALTHSEEELQGNWLNINDNEIIADCDIKENVTSSEPYMRMNKSPTQTVKGGESPTKATIKGDKTPIGTTIKGGKTPTQTANKACRREKTPIHTTIKGEESCTQTTINMIKTYEEDKTETQTTIKGAKTPTQTTTEACKGNKRQTQTTSQWDKSATQTTIKGARTPTQTTIKGDKSPTQTTIKRDKTATQTTFQRDRSPNKIAMKRNKYPTKTATNRNKFPTQAIKGDESPTKTKMKGEKTQSQTTIKGGKNPTQATTKTCKGNKSPSQKSQTNIKRSKSPTQSTFRACKGDKTQSQNTTKGDKTPTQITIKGGKSPTKTTFNESNTPTQTVTKECKGDKNPTHTAITGDESLTQTTIKRVKAQTSIKACKWGESEIKVEIKADHTAATQRKNDPNQATMKMDNSQTQTTIKDIINQTKSSIRLENLLTEPTFKASKTPNQSNMKENNITKAESTIKKNIPRKCTSKDENTPNISTIEEKKVPTQCTIKEKLQTEFSITEKSTPAKKTTSNVNHASTTSIRKENITPNKYRIRENITPSEFIRQNNPPNVYKTENSRMESIVIEKTFSSETILRKNKSQLESTFRASKTSSEFTTKGSNTLTMDPPAESTTIKCTIRSRNEKIPSNLDTTTEDPNLQEASCPAEILLMKAGDVELNPGPSERAPGDIHDQELVNLAYDIPPTKYTELCIALGITHTQSQAILTRHLMDIPGSLMEVFIEWRNRQRDGTNYRNVIANALCRANMDALGGKMIRGECLPLEPTSSGSRVNGTEPLTEEQVARCAQDFKTFYQTRLCKIKTDPLDFTTIKEFEDIYTDLVLLRNESGTTSKTSLKYQELLKIKVNKQLPKRLMVEGEGGAGKTTFCSKIAWDWTNEVKELKQFDWVLVIPLRDIGGDQTVGEIAKTYLSDSNPARPCQINEYILANPSKVFIIFDGLDEYVGDLVKQETDIAKIIRSEKFKECRVLVTTRPWKAHQIKSTETFSKIYAFIAVTGFNKDHVSIYITKYFKDDKHAADGLIKLIEGNDVIKENMAPFPLFVAMLCTLWTNSDANRRETIQKLKTFSQLFTTMIIFLKDHYISKHCQDHTARISIPKGEQINSMILVIGKFALYGVLDKKFEYTENDFRGYTEAMETCCRIGVLSREIRLVPLHKRSMNDTYPVTSRVFFPHKLFQEYLAGMYLSSLFKSELAIYERDIKRVIQETSEFRYLLYFTASQTKDVGLDITKRIMNLRTHSYYPKYDILVDVAFEAYDEDAAKVVGQHIFKEKNSLEIQDNMSAHTVSGYLFIMEKQTMETLILSRNSCGPTVSRDLADIICSSTSLSGFEISGTNFHADFYGILEGEIKKSKLKRLSIKRMDTPGEVQSRYLARFVNNLPGLKDLTLRRNNFHDCFYTELASGTGCVAETDNSVCKLLIDHRFCNGILQHGFAVEKIFPNLEELFLATLQSMSPNIIGSLAHSNLKRLSMAKGSGNYRTDEDEEEHPSLVDDPLSLEQVFLNSFPGLTDLKFKDLVIGNNRCETILLSLKQHQHLKDIRVIHCYTDEEIDPIASAINIEKRMNVKIQHNQEQKCLRCYQMSSGLADALCHRTSVQELILQMTQFDDAWFANKNGRTVNSKIQKLTLEGLFLERNDPSASRGLATFLCLQPCLTDLNISSYVWLHDEFYHEAARLSSSSKVQKSQNSVCRLLIDHRFCNDILQHGFTVEKLFPKLEELSFATLQSVSPDIIGSLAHSSLKKLSFARKDSEDYDIGEDEEEHAPLVGDPLSLEQVFLNSFPGLKDLTFKDLVIGNSRCEKILLSLKQHQHLKNIRVIHCFTDEEIDPIASTINTEKRMNVELQHDEREKGLRCYQMSSGLADALCHRTSVQELILEETQFDNTWFPNMSGRTVDSKIQKVTLEGLNLERNDPSASSDLATFLCLQPCLTDLNISCGESHISLHDEFYHGIARLALSSKIQNLTLEGLNLERNDPNASRDLARFLCLQPCLTDLNISSYDEYGHVPVRLHDDFYHELARRDSTSKLTYFSLQIQKLTFAELDLIGNDPSASRDLATFLCLQPCLTDVNISYYVWLHDEFYHEAARLASSSKIQKLTLVGLNLERNDPSASRDLATFLCVQPCLTDLNISFCDEVRLHDEFYREVKRLASSSKNPFFKNNVTWQLAGNSAAGSPSESSESESSESESSESKSSESESSESKSSESESSESKSSESKSSESESSESKSSESESLELLIQECSSQECPTHPETFVQFHQFQLQDPQDAQQRQYSGRLSDTDPLPYISPYVTSTVQGSVNVSLHQKQTPLEVAQTVSQPSYQGSAFFSPEVPIQSGSLAQPYPLEQSVPQLGTEQKQEHHISQAAFQSSHKSLELLTCSSSQEFNITLSMYQGYVQSAPRILQAPFRQSSQSPQLYPQQHIPIPHFPPRQQLQSLQGEWPHEVQNRVGERLSSFHSPQGRYYSVMSQSVEANQILKPWSTQAPSAYNQQVQTSALQRFQQPGQPVQHDQYRGEPFQQYQLQSPETQNYTLTQSTSYSPQHDHLLRGQSQSSQRIYPPQMINTHEAMINPNQHQAPTSVGILPSPGTNYQHQQGQPRHRHFSQHPVQTPVSPNNDTSSQASGCPQQPNTHSNPWHMRYHPYRRQ